MKKKKENMVIKIGGRLVKDLLESPRVIQEDKNKGIIIRLFLVSKDHFMVVKENVETEEQLYWSDIYELEKLLDTDYYVEIPIKGFIKPEFLIDLVGDRLAVFELRDVQETNYWITRLYKEEPILINRLSPYGDFSMELCSYESICFDDLNDNIPAYKSLYEDPHALAYIETLVSIDLPDERKTKMYWDIIQ